MAGDINVYEGASNSGTEWDDLASGLAAASSGDVIEISGAWTADDNGGQLSISLANLTIRAVGSAKYVPGSTGHYVRRNNASGHVIQFTGTGTLTLDGFELEQANGATSAEGVRIASNGTLTVEDMHIWSSDEVADQDGIYSYHDYSPTINVTNSIIHGFKRGGVHYQSYTDGRAGKTVGINVVSSSIYNCGSESLGDNGGVIYSSDNPPYFDQDVTIKVQDSLIHSTTGVGVGIVIASSGRTDGAGGVGTKKVDIDNTITNSDEDGAIGIDSFTNSIDGASFVESGSETGTGTEVVFEDLTTAPYDFSLTDVAANDAIDYHSDAGLLITLPTVDIVGTSRPQNTDYDLGAFEVVSGGGISFDETGAINYGSAVTATETFNLPSPSYDETATISSTYAVVSSEIYASPSYAENGKVDYSYTVTGNEVFGTVYNETATVSSSYAVDSSELYTGPSYIENGVINYFHIFTGTETFGTNYNETGSVNYSYTVTSSEIFTPPLPAYDEKGIVEYSGAFTGNETYSGPAYDETGRADYSYTVTAAEAFGTAYPETALINYAASVTAAETWTPPDFIEKAQILYPYVVTALETFDTPSRLPEGISRLTASRVDSFIAVDVGGFIARTI